MQREKRPQGHEHAVKGLPLQQVFQHLHERHHPLRFIGKYIRFFHRQVKRVHNHPRRGLGMAGRVRGTLHGLSREADHMHFMPLAHQIPSQAGHTLGAHQGRGREIGGYDE